MNTYFIEFLNINGVETSIKYSNTTRKYYVSTQAEAKEGGLLKSIANHEDTIEKAIESFNKDIQNKIVVINAYGENRKELSIPIFA